MFDRILNLLAETTTKPTIKSTSPQHIFASLTIDRKSCREDLSAHSHKLSCVVETKALPQLMFADLLISYDEVNQFFNLKT